MRIVQGSACSKTPGGVRFKNFGRYHGCRLRNRAIGGASGGCMLSFSLKSHSKGRWTTVPGWEISSSVRNVALNTASWRTASSRQPQGQPKGVFDRRNARDTDTLGQLRHHGKGDSTDPGGLDLSLNQSHGPAADRSNRHQHDRFYLFLAKSADDVRNSVTQQRVGPNGIPHV